MSYLLKDPAAVLDYAIDWGGDYLEPGDRLATSDWSIVPVEADGLSVAGSRFDASISTVNARGGIAGRIYRLVNRITTGSGRVAERAIVLRVANR